ncbi:CopG family antitoxin [Amphibiibacter pelophylacis]|uniref:BrnA antitoxin family protein n=1 Tax=Amphibiibacter pelophylacis TaxID=1799477 RepID=A0ACC6P211_9BURK
MKNPAKPMPTLYSDEAAEEFVATADLTQYDLSGFKPMQFEFQSKSAALNLRIPPSLLEALKRKASASGLPYTRYVRLLLENDVGRPDRATRSGTDLN